ARLAADPAAARAEPAETAAAVAAERAGTGDPVAARRFRTRPLQARSHRAPAAAEPARTAGPRTRGGGTALPRAAAARSRRGHPGGDLRRNACGAERPGPGRALGTRFAGRGSGRRADPRVEPRDGA